MLDGTAMYKWEFAPRPDGISHEIRLRSRAFATSTAGHLLPRSIQKERVQLPHAIEGWDRCTATAMGQSAGAYRSTYENIKYFEGKDRC